MNVDTLYKKMQEETAKADRLAEEARQAFAARDMSAYASLSGQRDAHRRKALELEAEYDKAKERELR